MKKAIFSIFTFLVVCIITTCLVACTKKDNTVAQKGNATIIYSALDKTIIKKVDVEFASSDTLVSLVETNFSNVTIENGMIMSMEDYVTPKDYNTFLSIYVDDTASLYGINDIKLYDGITVEFRITELSY